MSKIAFKRAYELKFFPGDESADSLLLAQGIGQTLNSSDPIVKSFAIDFQVKSAQPFYNSASKNTASITIYNLKNETARAIQEPGVFNLALGYVGTGWVTDVFSGSMINATYGKQGSDRFITLDLVSGRLGLKNQIFQKDYGKFTTTQQVVNDLVSFIQADYFSGLDGNQTILPITIDIQYQQIYENGLSLKGDAISLLAELLPDYYVYLNNKQVEVRPRRLADISYIYGNVFDLSPEYGEIYSNMTGTASIEDYTIMDTGIEAKTVLLPNLQVGDMIKLAQNKARFFDGYATRTPNTLDQTLYYEVKDVTHAGNTFNGEFTTTFTAKYITERLPARLDRDFGVLA